MRSSWSGSLGVTTMRPFGKSSTVSTSTKRSPFSPTADSSSAWRHTDAAQLVVFDLTRLDQLRRLTLGGRPETATAHDRERECEVRDEKRHRTDTCAGDRVVLADDAVLHRVRDGEQHDEVERAQLRELALAGEAEGDHEEPVHEQRAEDLLDDGDGESEHVVPHGHAGYDRALLREADRGAVDDLVEVLGQAVADAAVVERPLGHALGDAGDEHVPVGSGAGCAAG